MSITHPSEPPTIAELALLERDGNGARVLIGAMSDQALAELDDRLEVGLAQLRDANLRDPRVDDLCVLHVVVRWTLRHRRARATLDTLLQFAPR